MSCVYTHSGCESIIKWLNPKDQFAHKWVLIGKQDVIKEKSLFCSDHGRKRKYCHYFIFWTKFGSMPTPSRIRPMGVCLVKPSTLLTLVNLFITFRILKKKKNILILVQMFKSNEFKKQKLTLKRHEQSWKELVAKLQEWRLQLKSICRSNNIPRRSIRMLPPKDGSS